MPNCVKCGSEISEQQSDLFNGMCPECNRIFKYSKKKSGKPLLGTVCLLLLTVIVWTVLLIVMGWIWLIFIPLLILVLAGVLIYLRYKKLKSS
ncbi:MAG: hypothetical protein ACFFAN_18755 [Promethearchaeota archaeon]